MEEWRNCFLATKRKIKIINFCHEVQRRIWNISSWKIMGKETIIANFKMWKICLEINLTFHFILFTSYYYCLTSLTISQSVSSVTQSYLTFLRPHELQHARPPCPSRTPRVYPNPCPLSRWCHPAISSSVMPLPCPQSFPASGSLTMSQLFTSGGQSTGVSALVLPMNIQDWSLLEWTGWISLQSKGLSRVSSNTTVQKHQFFNTQLSL